MYTVTYFDTNQVVSYMLGEMEQFDYCWEILSGRTVELDGKQLYRLNNQEMNDSKQWVAYIMEGSGLTNDWLSRLRRERCGPMDHIERMRITRLRAFVKDRKPFPCASRPGCTPTILARLAEYAAYLLAKREK